MCGHNLPALTSISSTVIVTNTLSIRNVNSERLILDSPSGRSRKSGGRAIPSWALNISEGLVLRLDRNRHGDESVPLNDDLSIARMMAMASAPRPGLLGRLAADGRINVHRDELDQLLSRSRRRRRRLGLFDRLWWRFWRLNWSRRRWRRLWHFHRWWRLDGLNWRRRRQRRSLDNHWRRRRRLIHDWRRRRRLRDHQRHWWRLRREDGRDAAPDCHVVGLRVLEIESLLGACERKSM